MKRLLLAATAALLMGTGIALAQTTTSQTTTTVTPGFPLIVIPEAVTESVTRTDTITPADTTETTGRASHTVIGDRQESMTTTTTTSAPAVMIIQRSTTTTTE